LQDIIARDTHANRICMRCHNPQLSDEVLFIFWRTRRISNGFNWRSLHKSINNN